MKKFWFAAIAAACASVTAHAAGIGLYIQGGVGSFQSDIKDSVCPKLATDVYNATGDSTACSTKGPSGKLLVGYKITPNFAVELNYFMFGKERAVSTDKSGVTPVTDLDVTNKLSAYGIGGALEVPITEKWSAIGRFGFLRVKNKYSVDTISPTLLATIDYGNGSEIHPKYYLGAGLAYQVTPLLKLHGDLDYTKAKNVDYGNYGEHGLRLLTVGGSLNF